MNEIELCRALRDFITQVFSQIDLPAKSQEKEEFSKCRPPSVINGYLPPKRSTSEEDFPFILVRPESAESDNTSTEVTVSIIFGCYSKEFDGYENCLNAMSILRDALLSLPDLTIEKKFQLRDQIQWKGYAEQPYPFWQVDMTTHWLFRSATPMPYPGGF